MSGIIGFLFIVPFAFFLQKELLKNKIFQNYFALGIILFIEIYVLYFLGIDIRYPNCIFAGTFCIWALIEWVHKKVKHSEFKSNLFQKCVGFTLLAVGFMSYLLGQYSLETIIIGAAWLLLIAYKGYDKILTTSLGTKIKKWYEDKKQEIAGDQKKSRRFVCIGIITLLFLAYIVYNPYAGHIYRYRDQQLNGGASYILTERGIANRKLHYTVTDTKDNAIYLREHPEEINKDEMFPIKYNSLLHILDTQYDGYGYNAGVGKIFTLSITKPGYGRERWELVKW